MRSGVVSPHPSAEQVRQASLDDLGQPLREVRFCVLDLELASHRVVVEGPGATGAHHVEAGQIAARRAAIPRSHDVGL